MQLGVGVIGTVVVAISGARNTRKATEQTIDAERRPHLLDKRADAYQAVVADLLARQGERNQKFHPIRMDDAGSVYKPDYPPYEVANYYEKFARLLTYCTPETRKLFDESTEADSKVAVLYREYLAWLMSPRALKAIQMTNLRVQRSAKPSRIGEQKLAQR